MVYKDKYYAKSDKTTIFSHSKDVAEVANEIAKQSASVNDEVLNAINYGALLHDIGKLTTRFQKNLTEEVKIKGGSFRHNEIGWAFLVKYLNFSDKLKKYILDSVYWHHGISNKLMDSSSCEILSTITVTDVKKMMVYLVHIVGEENTYTVGDDSATPLYYNGLSGMTDEYNTFIRSCVIGGDRLVSSLDTGELAKINTSEYITSIINKDSKIVVGETDYSGSDRFKNQCDIVSKVNHTTIIKAPAGFGKTLLGLMWGLKTDKKLIWVCPRNIVAQSVYESVLSDLKSLRVDANVELFLHNELVESNYDNQNGFSSDIIITNIDSFLAPSFNNGKSNNLFLINNANVVFDEYHELITDTALMSCFINIMRIRHMIMKNDTLLLSATPIPMGFLWEGITKTNILPSKTTHYNAAHTGNYDLNIIGDIIDQPVSKGSNTLCIFNAIKSSQKYLAVSGFDKLLHSSFPSDRRTKDFKDLLLEYGKSSGNNIGKSDVSGTHIIQASLDISFLNLYESILSPESTLQRVGRVDRWGTYTQTPTINIYKSNNSSEVSSRAMLYDEELCGLWFEFISQYKGTITLDKLYEIYNEFNNTYADTIKEYINKTFFSSRKVMKKIYPNRYNEPKKKSSTVTSGGNMLRSNGKEIFYITKVHGSVKYSDAFSVKVYRDYDIDFHEKKGILNQLENAIKSINKSKDPRFDFSKYNKHKLKHTSIDEIRRNANKSNTPYIIFDRVYHEKYGIIKKDLLSELES